MSKYAYNKRQRQEAYEAACRTPGTPEYAARQARFDRDISEHMAERDRQEKSQRQLRAEQARVAQRRVIASLVKV